MKAESAGISISCNISPLMLCSTILQLFPVRNVNDPKLGLGKISNASAGILSRDRQLFTVTCTVDDVVH